MTILFEHLFRDHILQRGYSYFQDGAVRNLKRDRNQIWATVQGSEDYTVYIELKDDGIEILECSCPYFQDSHNCKHLAAVLYALDEEDGELEVPSDLSLSLEILESLPQEDIIDFFGRELQINEALRTRFLSMYQERGILSESLYLRQIDSVFRFHLGSSGYIEYDEVDAFSSDVNAIISSIQELIDKEEYTSACTLTRHLVDKVSRLEIDDSSGTISWIARNLIDILKRILDEGPGFLHQAVFDWLYPGLREGELGDISGDLTDVLMMYFFEEGQLHKKLALIEEKLRPYEEKKWRFGEPRRSYWLGHKLKTLWALGYEERAQQLLGINRDLPELRLLVVERHLSFGEYERAMDLLKDGKERFKDHWGMADRYSRKLMEVYHRLGDHHALRWEGLLRVLDYAPGQLDAYLEYKSMVSPQEWPSERDYVLHRLREKGVDLKKIYAKENLSRELVAALQEDFNHWDLDTYEELLKDNFTDEMRDLLVRRVIEWAEHAGGRRHYVKIKEELGRIAKYPGGPSIVEELKEKWARKYKNRWAMVEELGLERD